MPRESIRILLIALTMACWVLAGCSGIDAARDAGERVSGGGGQEAPAAEPREAPSEASAAGQTATGSTFSEATGAFAGEGAREESTETTTTELVLDPKWYKDSDGNIVPDFIEAEADGGAGNDDPYTDDCAPEKCPGGADSVELLTRPRNELLILDSSGSMSADDGSGAGRTKMEAAKEALSRYAGVSASLFETGFAVYGHTGNATEAGREQSCADAAETLAPIGEVEADTFDGTLSRFEPTGWTPIEGALREAGNAFAGREGEFNKVVLVSDGIETCGGDPVAAARELQRSGIRVEVDVVGFDVPDDKTAQLEEVALAGGGEYFDARTGADLDEYFQQQSEALGQTWDAFTCQLRNSTFDSACDAEQCQDATVFRIPEEQAKYEIGSPEYQALQDLSDRIGEGLERRDAAREEARIRSEQLYEQWQKLEGEYLDAYQRAYGV